MQHIDYGLGILRKDAFAELPDGENFDLSLVYQQLIAREQLAGFEVAHRFYEIGSFEGLEEMRAHFSVVLHNGINGMT
jgi:NDP-sugar pyrophosphorylase family protein